MPGLHQSSLTELRPVRQSTADRMTDSTVKWTGRNCKSKIILEDIGSTKVLTCSTSHEKKMHSNDFSLPTPEAKLITPSFGYVTKKNKKTQTPTDNVCLYRNTYNLNIN